MTTLTLHKLPKGFIVTSDEPEENINPKVTYYDDKVDSNGLVTLSEMFTERLNTYLVKGIKENKRYVYKVIAQQDQIDFSALTKEEQKEIGWFNIYKLFQEDSFEVGVDGHSALTTYTAGFQKSQELLSDRRFTLEEVGELLQQIVRIIPEQELRKWTKESFVKHFGSLENRSWTIEVEMGEYSLNSDGEPIGFPDMSKPKFSSGKIKITKIL